MPSRRAQALNANTRNANIVPIVPYNKVQMQNFRQPIDILAKSMTNKNNQQVLVPTSRNDQSMAARVCDFVRMNLSMLLGLHVGKDPQKFIDEVKKYFV